MKLTEQIIRIQGIMGIINEDKKERVFEKIFNDLFNNLTMIKGSDDRLVEYQWVNEEGEIVYERNDFGIFWVNDCDYYKLIKNYSNLLGIKMHEMEEIIVNYLNKLYVNEFRGEPLKKLNTEECDWEF